MFVRFGSSVRLRASAWARRALAVGLLAAAQWPLAAQWIEYPTAGVPRNADGTPNLAAPAPRTPDGKPDLQGLWTATELLPECSAEDCIPQQGLPADQVNIGRNLAGGLPYQPWAAALVAERTGNGAKDDPHAHCLPPNFPRAYTFPQLVKILWTPTQLVMLHEFNATYRQVFLDGRPLPEDPHPTWSGYSTGRWEGDTLVVESNGFRDDLWLDMGGSPLSDAARITERFRRVNYGSLEIDVTVNDPKAYTRPWSVTLKQSIVLDTDLIEEYCLENEQDTRLFDVEGAGR
jgi:hypothetical protein